MINRKPSQIITCQKAVYIDIAGVKVKCSSYSVFVEKFNKSSVASGTVIIAHGDNL